MTNNRPKDRDMLPKYMRKFQKAVEKRKKRCFVILANRRESGYMPKVTISYVDIPVDEAFPVVLATVVQQCKDINKLPQEETRSQIHMLVDTVVNSVYAEAPEIEIGSEG